jgi:acyl carrier protein
VVTKEDIERRLTEAVLKVNGTDPADERPDRLAPELSLAEDLDVDSLAMVELAEEIEDRFEVSVPEDAMHDVKTFGDAVEFVGALLR